MIHKISQRFDPAIITQIVNDYATGIPTTQLTSLYGIGKGTMLISSGRTAQRSATSHCHPIEAKKPSGSTNEVGPSRRSAATSNGSTPSSATSSSGRASRGGTVTAVTDTDDPARTR